MKIAVIQFPGSNCESESVRAIQTAGMEAEEFLWNRRYSDLEKFDGYCIVGGFSYEDRSRSGIIASLDPLMPFIRVEAQKGKPVLGICNGAQILVETGMVPGLAKYELGMALAENKRVKDNKVIGTGFYNAWVHTQMTVPSNSSAFTRHMAPGQIMRVPIAHGEGRFIIPDALLQELIKFNQTVFRYSSGQGEIVNEFPINPNGATYNLAAVTNPAGNVMAIMPHPERTKEGLPIFTSMRDYIAEKKTLNIPKQLEYSPAPATVKKYLLPSNAFELPVKLVITDNEAATVENTLKNLGLDVKVERFVHWEVSGNTFPSQPFKQSVIETGELFNKNKESITYPEQTGVSLTLLVRYKDDFVGEQKHEILNHRLTITDVQNVKRGVLWQITPRHATIKNVEDLIFKTHILFNPYSQECYFYEL